MKKNLFMMAVALVMTVQASAQLQPKLPLQKLKGQPQMMQSRSAKATTQQAMVAPVTKAQVPQKATKLLPPLESYASEMYYTRPEGTFYNTFQGRDDKYYGYLFAPNFTELTWKNMTDEARKADTYWTINDEEVDADENNDYTTMYAIQSGYLNYVPSLWLVGESYTFGDNLETAYAQVGVIATDSISSLMKWDVTQGHSYSGYSDGSYGYGTGTTMFDFDGDGEKEEVYSDGVVELFDKPVSPLYLSSIYIPVVSNQTEQEKMFAEGSELTVEIFKLVTTEDGWELDEEPMATMKANELLNFGNFTGGDGSYGAFEVSMVEVDAFGTEYNVPLIIDDAFAVVITGFAQEGVDLGLRFGNAAAVPADFATMKPTFERYYDSATGEYKGMLRTYGKAQTGDLYCYNAVMYLEAMWDKAYVEDNMLDYTIPVEGGIMESVAEFTNSTTGEKYHENVIEVYNQLPWFNNWEGAAEDEENYFIATTDEEWPEWLELSGFSDQYYNDYMLNLLQFKAEALPEGVKGRQAHIVIYSEKGAESKVITITQGEVEEECITEINVDREVGQGYDVTRFEPDFTEALAYLGIENPTDATLVGINADGSEEAAPNGPIDGWCDADGNFIGWGKEETRICVKFFPAVPQYEICDMNGADEVGKTYTVKYGLKANDKMAIFVINVTFIEKQEHIYKPEIVKTIEISHLEKAATAYCEEEPAPTFDVAEVCAALGIANMSEAKAYIVNLTDGNFVENTGSIDGWRNADGDAAPWAQCANGFCLKLNNPASGEFDYTGAHDDNFQVGDTYVAQWGIVANEKAVLLKVTITFVDDPAGINEINADENAGAIFNINGVRMQKAQQKGIYIQNGKKIVIK